MVHAAVEVERKYDVDAHVPLPTLEAFAPEDHPPVDLRAVYYDTDRDDLARRRITLRRREGGHDAGWHAKLPGSEGRTELRAPLADTVPAELIEVLAGALRLREVSPIARLDTRRSARILHLDGLSVAEAVDDAVTAVDLRTGTRRRWREWEVELLSDASDGPGGREMLDRIERELRAAGARPAASASKLARALGRSALGRERPGAPLADLVDDVASLDPRVRLGDPGAVERMRDALRTLGDVLAVDSTLRTRAARAVAELEDADGIPALLGRDAWRELLDDLDATADSP